MAKSIVAEKLQKFVASYVDAIALKIYAYINQKFDALVKQVIVPLEDASNLLQENVEGMQEVYAVTTSNLAVRLEALILLMQKEGTLDPAKYHVALMETANVHDCMQKLVELPFAERVQAWQDWNANNVDYMRISKKDMRFAQELQSKELQLTLEERIAFANQLELGSALVEKLQSVFGATETAVASA